MTKSIFDCRVSSIANLIVLLNLCNSFNKKYVENYVHIVITCFIFERDVSICCYCYDDFLENRGRKFENVTILHILPLCLDICDYMYIYYMDTFLYIDNEK